MTNSLGRIMSPPLPVDAEYSLVPTEPRYEPLKVVAGFTFGDGVTADSGWLVTWQAADGAVRHWRNFFHYDEALACLMDANAGVPPDVCIGRDYGAVVSVGGSVLDIPEQNCADGRNV